MNRKLICLLLLIALLMTGCARVAEEPGTVSNEEKYLTRINFYSKSGKLLDRYRIEYTPNGVPVKISSGIEQGQHFENTLGGAPLLPDGVQLDQADRSYSAVLIAPCDDGKALLVSGTAQEPLWGMILYGDDYEARNGYLTKVTAGDGSYVAFFYTSLTDASATGSDPDDNSFAVTEDSEYYGYDAVLSTLGTALRAMENGDPVSLNEMLFSPLYDSERNKNEIGYVFIDLDGNGTKELIIGSNGQYAHSVIYDLYAIYNGRIVNVLSSTADAQHMLDGSNNILMDTKNSDGQTIFAVFSYYNSTIRLLDALIQGRGELFHSSESFSNPDTFEEIDRAEYEEIHGRYQQIDLEWTPVFEYMDATSGTADAD